MKIISNFRDYYDCLQNSDKNVIFNRVDNIQETITFDSKSNISSDILRHRFQYYANKKYLTYDRIYSSIIVFCNQFYIHKPISLDNIKSKTSIQYEILKLDDYINNISKKRKSKTKKRYSGSFGLSRKYNALIEIKNYFKNYCIDKQVVYFKIITSNDIKHNQLIIVPHFDNLKDYEFYKMFDVYTAFQEIEMFIGNYLNSGNNKKIVNISDSKTLLESKGFNAKTSFRHPIK